MRKHFENSATVRRACGSEHGLVSALEEERPCVTEPSAGKEMNLTTFAGFSRPAKHSSRLVKVRRGNANANANATLAWSYRCSDTTRFVVKLGL